jgi:enamine deaminase RidA (YjgF/YER057c/UK114 family)
MTRRIRTGSQLEQLAAYSRAVEHDGWVFVSGTMGTDPATGQLPGSLTEQADNAFATIKRALAQLGVRFSDIVQCRVFISERALVPELIPLLKKAFDGIEPANTTVIAQLPHPDAKIEIEVVAFAGAGGNAD